MENSISMLSSVGELPKDLICHLGTFVDCVDLPNFFLISKTFNENTNKNYHFWYKKLLKDFSYSYDSIYDLATIQQHYHIVHYTHVYGSSNFYLESKLSKAPHFTTLYKYLVDKKKLEILKCQYVFSRVRGQKCNKNGKRYGKYIFCSNCIKKRPVQQMIDKQFE